MDGEDTPKNKIGYENEPDYSTLRGAQAQEIDTPQQPSLRDKAANTAATAEQTATTAAAASKAVASGGADVKADIAAIKGAVNFASNVKGKGEEEQGVASSGLKKAAPILGALLLILIPIAFLAVPLIMPFHLLANIVSKFDSNAGIKEAAEQSYIAMIDGNADLTDATLESIGYDGISQEACDELFETPYGSIEYYSGHNTQGCVPTQLALIGNPPDPSAEAYFKSKLLEGAVLADTGTPSTSNPYAYSGAFKWTDRDGYVHWIGPDNFNYYYHFNNEFFRAISQGSLAWTGTFSGWFDDMVRELMQKLDLTRNTFQGFYEDVTDQLESRENYYEVISKVNEKNTLTHASNEHLLLLYECEPFDKGIARKIEITDTFADYITATLVEKGGGCNFKEAERPAGIEDLCDPNYRWRLGNNGLWEEYIYDYTCPEWANYDTTTSTKVGDKIDDASGVIQAYLPEMAKSFMTIARRSSGGFAGDGVSMYNPVVETCAQLYGLSYFSVIVAASRLNQASTFAAQALEAVDKTRAGLGSEAGIHQLGKQLSETGTYTYMEAGGGEVFGLDSFISTSTTNRPALNSQGLSWLNTNSAVDQNNLSVETLSVEGILKGFVLSTELVATCTAYSYVRNTLYGLVSLLTGRSGKTHNNFDANDLFMGSLAGRHGIIDQAVRYAAYALVFNPCTTDADGNLATNENVGDCIALGSHNYLSQNHRLSGGSPADEAKLKQFVEQRRRTIAREAELDREQRSPFDVYSPNTFLGSIVGRVSPYVASLTNSNIFTSISNIVGNSINSLLPTASALQTDTLMANTRGTDEDDRCKFLHEIGAVGDAFCLPYTITDVALFDPEIAPMSAKAVEDYIATHKFYVSPGVGDQTGFEGLNEQNNRIINPKSNLAKYIKYCSNRIALFGIIDANIAKDFIEESEGEEDVGWFQSLIRKLMSLLTLGFYEFLRPKGSEAEGMELMEEALTWADGRNCVATDRHTTDTITPNFWNEQGRYYQAYMTYQRININRSGGKGNNAIEVVQAYNAKHPLNTHDDRIAATAGMLPEDYAAVKNYIAYQAADLSSHGPTIASVSTPSGFKLKRSITPLTDFLIEKIIPITTPSLIDPRQQGTTA